MYKNNGVSGRAFDAAGSSGMAFLNSQLELINPDLVKPLQAVTHTRDITIESGGGFAEFISSWASNYATTGGNQYGLQGNDNTDIALVQTDIQKATWRAFNWAAAMVITLIDLEKMELATRTGMAPPFSLQQLQDDAVKSIWAKAMDRVTYLGWLNQPGIINNTNVTASVVAANSNGHTTWAAKLGDTTGPSDILNDVNTGINSVTGNSGYDIDEGMPDTLLIPWTEYGLLTRPMALGGVGTYESIIKYIERNCVAAQHGKEFKIFPLPSPWIAGQGTSQTDRGVLYKNAKKSLYLRVPQPVRKALTVPTTRDGGAYETIFNGCIGQVMWLRSTTAQYIDGLG